MVERLVTKLLDHMACNIEDRAYYAKESGGCPSQASALSRVAEALRDVDVPYLMKELLEPEKEREHETR